MNGCKTANYCRWPYWRGSCTKTATLRPGQGTICYFRRRWQRLGDVTRFVPVWSFWGSWPRRLPVLAFRESFPTEMRQGRLLGSADSNVIGNPELRDLRDARQSISVWQSVGISAVALSRRMFKEPMGGTCGAILSSSAIAARHARNHRFAGRRDKWPSSRVAFMEWDKIPFHALPNSTTRSEFVSLRWPAAFWSRAQL